MLIRKSRFLRVMGPSNSAVNRSISARCAALLSGLDMVLGQRAHHE
jgi:hypothetical protein